MEGAPLIGIVALTVGMILFGGGFRSSLAQAALHLGALREGCAVEKRLTGLGNTIGAWLRCDEQSVLLTHPLNLVGHVNIQSEEEALEFVRLFSSRDTYFLFPYFGRVEVLPSKETGAYALEEQKFREIAKLPEVKRVGLSNGHQASFQIKRAVVLLSDVSLYETTEIVHENGLWECISNRLLYKDVSQLGIISLGPL
jgi:hypothetical protein